MNPRRVRTGDRLAEGARSSQRDAGRRCSAVLFGLAVLVGSFGARGADDDRAEEQQAVLLPGGLEAPGDAVRLCSGHVSAPRTAHGNPGPHITWDAYSSGEDASGLSARFAESLGEEADAVEGGCSTWRFPPERPRAVLEVCPVSAQGPWSDECPPPPSEAASLILTSTMAVADDEH